MRGLPWFKFFPADWRAETALRACSPVARLIWLEMMLLAHEATPYGHVLINGRPPTTDQFARAFALAKSDLEVGVAELEQAGVFSRTDAGVIFSRRMVRDADIRIKRQDAGKKGGAAAFASGFAQANVQANTPANATAKPSRARARAPARASEAQRLRVNPPAPAPAELAEAPREPDPEPAIPAAAAPSAHHEFIAWWATRFLALTGRAYAFGAKKDGDHVKTLLARAGGSLPALQAAADRLFADPFWRKNGVDLATLVAQWNKLESAGRRPPANGTARMGSPAPVIDLAEHRRRQAEIDAELAAKRERRSAEARRNVEAGAQVMRAAAPPALASRLASAPAAAPPAPGHAPARAGSG